MQNAARSHVGFSVRHPTRPDAARIERTARTTLKCSDFGMTWNAGMETGGVVVGDEIELELEIVKKK